MNNTERFEKECNEAINFMKSLSQKVVEVDGFSLTFNGDSEPYTFTSVGELIEKTVRGKKIYSVEFSGARDRAKVIPKADGSEYQYGEQPKYEYIRYAQAAEYDLTVKVEINEAEEKVAMKVYQRSYNEETRRSNLEQLFKTRFSLFRVYSQNAMF